MTIEQEKALKVVEKLISDMGCHVLSAEEIMILTQGIMSNDCGGCNWKYVQVPHYQPGLEPDRQPGWRPGEVWCESSTSNIAYLKNENEMIEEVRKTLEKNGDPIIPTTQELIKNGQWKDVGEQQPSICAGDNIPSMQYVIR